jgi:hypothetical protein
MPTDITQTLEEMIDRYGVTHVVTGLSLVCFEKAEHLRTNWQDKVTAKAWDADGKALDKVARLLCSDG